MALYTLTTSSRDSATFTVTTLSEITFNLVGGDNFPIKDKLTTFVKLQVENPNVASQFEDYNINFRSGQAEHVRLNAGTYRVSLVNGVETDSVGVFVSPTA